MSIAFIGLPTIIGGIVLGVKYLKIMEKSMERGNRELEIAERKLILQEKETELETRKLELEISLLENQSVQEKLLNR